MWAILKPLTKSPIIETEILSTIVPGQDSLIPQKDVSVVMTEIDRITDSIVMDHTLTHIYPNVRKNVKIAAKEWFNCLVHHILENAASKISCAIDDVKPGISAPDMLWAIKNLPKEKLLSCIGYCYHELMVLSGFPGTVLIYHFLREYKDLIYLEDESSDEEEYEDYMEKCWKSHSVEKNLLPYITISSGGRLLLYRWICATLSSCLRDAAISEGEEDIEPGDLVQAFCKMGEKMFGMMTIPSQAQEPNDANSCQLMDLKKRRKSVTYVPHDIIESSILPCLPYDFILKLRHVCKEWKKSICSVNFERSLQERHKHPLQSSFGIINAHDFGIKLKEIHVRNDFELVAVDTISTLDMWPVFYSACSGFLSFALCTKFTTVFTIGNPVTGEWKRLPPLDYEYDAELGPGLAVDLSSNPPWYKLVTMANGDDEFIFRVFSSDTNEWNLSVPTDPISSPGYDEQFLIRKGDSVYVDGKLYWVLFWESLRSYDLKTEMMEDIDLPGSTGFFGYSIGSLDQPDGKQRLTCCKCIKGAVEAYVCMEDSRWEKLWSIGVSRNFMPLPYSGGEIVVLWDNGRLFAYNTTTGERSLVVKYIDYAIYARRMFEYRMTLTRLP